MKKVKRGWIPKRCKFSWKDYDFNGMKRDRFARPPALLRNKPFGATEEYWEKVKITIETEA